MASTIAPGGLKPEIKQPEGGTSSVRIAIEGCGHGTLHNIYAAVAASCKAKGWPGVDLLIICGDFQSTRNAQDLHAMAVPLKYRAMGDFYEYYNGDRVAPYLTLFVGGNHEASNYLFELYYGGWVAPNIYYMGAANVLRLGGLRFAGLSGIWKGFDYNKPHHERLPYSDDTVRSIYHVRELDTRKLLQIRTQVDIGLSHDWPQGIVWCGNSRDLFRRKAHLEEDARSGRLGSVAAKQVLHRLRPTYWFSAHLHVRFEATVKHVNEDEAEKTGVPGEQLQALGLEKGEPASTKPQVGTEKEEKVANSDEIKLDLTDSEKEESLPPKDTKDGATNPDEIQLEDTDEAENDAKPTTKKPVPEVAKDVSQDLRSQLPDSFKPRPAQDLPFPKDIKNLTTKFLALDKCLPGRDFLQLLQIPSPKQISEPRSSPLQLEYDKEWLAITRVFAKDLVVGKVDARVPRTQGERSYYERIQKEEAWVEEQIVAKGSMVVPENFVQTAPLYDRNAGPQSKERPIEYLNPQTSQFCEMLDIPNPFPMSEEEVARRTMESIRKSNDPAQSQRGGRGGHGHYQPRGGRGRGGNHRGRGRGRGYGH